MNSPWTLRLSCPECPTLWREMPFETAEAAWAAVPLYSDFLYSVPTVYAGPRSQWIAA